MAKSYGNPTWRADVSLPNDIPSQPAMELHLTITNPFVKTQLSKAGKVTDSAILHGEQHKNNAIGKHLPPPATSFQSPSASLAPSVKPRVPFTTLS